MIGHLELAKLNLNPKSLFINVQAFFLLYHSPSIKPLEKYDQSLYSEDKRAKLRSNRLYKPS